MLNLTTSKATQHCDGVSRRGCLQVGSLALGGLTLPQLLAAREQANRQGLPAKDVSVVLLFLTGGPSQVETFDPKMTAPAESRSATGEVRTDVPGVTFGGTFPLLARHASRMAIVRSFTHGNSNHTGAVEDVMRCGNTFDAGMGSLVTSLRGSSDRILLIITGEFGRTPKVKPDGGRDHWPRLSTLAFAGGGLKMGQIIGTSDSRVGEPQSRPVTLDQLLGTVLDATLDLPTIRSQAGTSSEHLSTFDRVEPIRELFG